jgi:hypothetical protein
MPPKNILLRLASGQPKKNEGREGRAVGSYSVMLPSAQGRRGAKKVRRPAEILLPRFIMQPGGSSLGFKATPGLVPVEL